MKFKMFFEVTENGLTFFFRQDTDKENYVVEEITYGKNIGIL